jgi:hypothetical protein
MSVSQFGCILRRMVESVDERAAAIDLDEVNDVAAAADFVIEPQAFSLTRRRRAKTSLWLPIAFPSASTACG